MKLEFSGQVSKHIQIPNFVKLHLVGAKFRAVIVKLKVTFRNFAKTPN
jgi:hypothetical protein